MVRFRAQICAALASAVVCGCAGAPVDTQARTSSAISRLPLTTAASSPAPSPASGYQLSEEELKYDCKKLTGLMQIRILQMRGYDSNKKASAAARGMQTADDADLRRHQGRRRSRRRSTSSDLAMLEAYNRQLAVQAVQDLRPRRRARRRRRHDATPAPCDRNTKRRAGDAGDCRRARILVYTSRRDDHRKRHAGTSHQSADTADRPSTVPWPPIVLAGVAHCRRSRSATWRPLGWPGIDDTPARVIGRGIGVAGIVLLVWAIMTLRRHGTTVLPDVGATSAGHRRPLLALSQSDLSRRRDDPARRRRADQERLARRRRGSVRRAGHLARHPAGGAPPRAALRARRTSTTRRSRAAGFEEARWPPTSARRNAPSSTA